MHPKSQRRVHGAEFKAQVLADCQVPGASVPAVALGHGLNVNLVRKWLVGRGVKRTGLAAPSTVSRASAAAAEPVAASLQFIPVELDVGGCGRYEYRGCGAGCLEHPRRAGPRGHATVRALAVDRGRLMRRLVVRTGCGAEGMIRADSLWLCSQPQDMRAGADQLLAVVVNTLGEARAHHGYIFANARASRLKLLVHDGFGVWCATRRLNAGHFIWHAREPGSTAPALQLSTQQFEALVLGLPWQRLGELSTIRRC